MVLELNMRRFESALNHRPRKAVTFGRTIAAAVPWTKALSMVDNLPSEEEVW